MNNDLYTSIILVGRNYKGDINAARVNYSKYGGYDWLADVDINKLPLNSFPSILNYLQQGYNLELKYWGDEMISAAIVSMQRDGGYKEPYQRVVECSHNGYGCLKKLENDLSVQLQFENQNNEGSVNKMLLKKVTKKTRCAKIKIWKLVQFPCH